MQSLQNISKNICKSIKNGWIFYIFFWAIAEKRALAISGDETSHKMVFFSMDLKTTAATFETQSEDMPTFSIKAK